MKLTQNLPVLLISALCILTSPIHGSSDHERKPYIVYMGELPESRATIMDDHHSLLSTIIGDEKIARESKIYSYGKSFNGFAAMLLPEEAKRLSDEDSVVSVFPNTRRKLRTTRSWDFLGMPETSTQRNCRSESDIIVGLLDTGIWVKAPSFNDKGYGPPPARWKGKCVTGANFTGCNNKVIGAKFFDLLNVTGHSDTEKPSPVDMEGHGTHTSSTVAGTAVHNASLFGIGKGTARGGVPSARIAMYKACWGPFCFDMDLLAGLDEAIADGVDLISISIGGPSMNFFQDSIAIGSFHAMKKGILVSCSAGNSGPYPFTVENVAPWILTVGASSIDRRFITPVKLGDSSRANGISINTFASRKQMYPLTSGALASNVSSMEGNSSACDYGTIGMDKVKGKIVYCLGYAGQDTTIKELGGVGAILRLSETLDVAFSTVLSAASMAPKDAKKIEHYINSTKNPQAVIHKTRTAPMDAPFVASFSSRGPQLVSFNILKPDISAPGLNILAAFSKLASTSGMPDDDRHVPFNIISGTSMACPHAAAAAAYVKSFHPDWSPAAIKSALMTTATPMKIKDEDGELGSGSGQINPVKALNPGLVYDVSFTSYIQFLCKEGYNSTTIGMLVGGKKKYKCSDYKPARGTDGLNYPSIHTQIRASDSTVSAVFYRTVTNVGKGKSVYKANVVSPKGIWIKVIPNTLKFSRLHQQRSFKVIVKGSTVKTGEPILSGSLEWTDLKHNVKSIIVITKSLK